MMWETRKLGDVLKVVRGSSPRPIKNYVTDSEDGVNWVKIGDVDERDKYVTRTKEKISRIGAEKSRFVDVGDFIFSNSMSFGRAYIMAIPGYIHDGWFTFKLPDYLNPDYLWYLFRSPLLVEQIKGLAAGAIVQNISSDLIKKCDLPIPPLEEQQKIVEKLDKAFELIDQAKANIEQNIINTKELFKSKLDEVFSQKRDGWMDVTLKDICFKITDGSHNPPKALEISNFIMLSSKNIIDDKITYDNPRHISEEDYFTENKRTNVEENDVLLTIVGTIGRVAVVPKMDTYFTLQRSVAVLKPNLEVLRSDFLKYTLQAKLEYLESNARGVAQKGIYLNQLKNIEIAIPSIIEQNRIVDKLSLLQNESKILLGKYQQKLSNLEELRKSILEKAFKGELTH